MRIFYNQILAVGESNDGIVKTEKHDVVLKSDYENLQYKVDKLAKELRVHVKTSKAVLEELNLYDTQS